MREKIRTTLIWIIVVFVTGVGCFLIGYKSSEKNQDKCKEEPKIEKKEEPKKEEINANLIVEPYLDVLNYCEPKETFYFQKLTKYEDLDPTIAIDIALRNATPEERKKLDEELNKPTDETDSFPDIETSHIEEKIKYTFGKDKTIKFPKKLNFESDFTSYDLKGNKYTLAAQGGGCTGPSDYYETKIVDSSKDNEKLVVQVNYIYVSYDVDNITEAEDPIIPVIFYNSLSKDREIAKLEKNGTEEKEADILLDGNKTDYLLFTFTLEDDHYILEQIEMKER